MVTCRPLSSVLLTLLLAVCGTGQAQTDVLAQEVLAQEVLAQEAPPAPTSQTSANDPDQSFSARLLNLIPADYTGRFGSVQAFADSKVGYGVRYFPLPFKADARLTYISHPKYQEYGVSVRYADTTFAAGRYQNDDADALLGVGHLEVTHNPGQGWQYGALYQDQGRSSRYTAGYALVDGPIRLLSEVGYAYQGSAETPYFHMDLSGGKSVTQGTYTAGLYSTLRTYVFPADSQVSLDISGSVTIRPSEDSSLTFSEFERFAGGGSPIPDLAVARYSRSNFDAVYLAKARAGMFSLRSFDYHWQHSFLDTDGDVSSFRSTVRADLAPPVVIDLTPHYDFVANEGGVRTDLFYRADFLPVLVGPSIDYIWSDKGNRWVITFKSGAK